MNTNFKWIFLLFLYTFGYIIKPNSRLLTDNNGIIEQIKNNIQKLLELASNIKESKEDSVKEELTKKYNELLENNKKLIEDLKTKGIDVLEFEKLQTEINNNLKGIKDSIKNSLSNLKDADINTNRNLKIGIPILVVIIVIVVIVINYKKKSQAEE